MRFSTILTLLAASYAAAIPLEATKDGDGKDGKKGDGKDGKKGDKNGGDVAVCEVQTAAGHVACINGCGKDAACVKDCTSVAVKGYIDCAGVKAKADMVWV